MRNDCHRCQSQGLHYSGVSRPHRKSATTADASAIASATVASTTRDPSSMTGFPAEASTESFTCPSPGCNKTYTTYGSMSQHKRNKHPELVQKRSATTSPHLLGTELSLPILPYTLAQNAVTLSNGHDGTSQLKPQQEQSADELDCRDQKRARHED